MTGHERQPSAALSRGPFLLLVVLYGAFRLDHLPPKRRQLEPLTRDFLRRSNRHAFAIFGLAPILVTLVHDAQCLSWRQCGERSAGSPLGRKLCVLNLSIPPLLGPPTSPTATSSLLAYCRKRDDVQKLIRGEVDVLPAHG
jgi:hypothetical protein